MQFKIEFDGSISKSSVYDEYSRFLYRRIKRSLKRYVKQKSKNYEVRKPIILKLISNYLKKEISDIDLEKYVINSLELVNLNGVYIVRLDESKRVKGLRLKVSTLVRLLEFGNENVRELPVVRKVLSYYKEIYQSLFYEFMEEKFGL